MKKEEEPRSGEGRSGGKRPEPQRLKERAYSSTMALRPLASRKRVPVAVKRECLMMGSSFLTHSSFIQRNQASRFWSKTSRGLLHSLANSAPQPVPPLTV